MATQVVSNKQPTPKENSFCIFYFALKNGAESARRAGYPIKSARQIANELLTKPYIQERLAEFADRATPDADKAIALEIERKRILSRIARTDVPEESIKPEHVIRSIDSLNRMEGIGQPETVNNFHGEVKILVVYEDRQRMLPTVEET